MAEVETSQMEKWNMELIFIWKQLSFSKMFQMFTQQASQQLKHQSNHDDQVILVIS